MWSSGQRISGEPDWAELAGRLEGELDCRSLAKRLYRQDASIYEEEPLGVVRPKHTADCAALVAWAGARRIPLIPRAGGTSLAGQCVGKGLVVDTSRHMRGILALDPAARVARVQPGVVQDDLNEAAAPSGLHFAPDTSTSRQAAIGGMIGNNSCGAYSILHGTTRDHVLEIEALLADGSHARFGPLEAPALQERLHRPTWEGRVYRMVFDLVDRHHEAILAAYPKPSVRRRNSGYALDELARGQPWHPDGPPFDLTRLLCGSEGTLGLVTEALVRLTPLPRHRRLLCAHFATVDEACRATASVLTHRPAAVELMDGALLEATRRNREQAANRFWIQGEPGAVLAIELQDDTAEGLAERGDALRADLRARGLGYAHPVIEADRMARVWALRKAGLGLLNGLPGDAKPATAIEDLAVAVEDLAPFVETIEALMKRHGCACVYYGHASVGLLHYRPRLNLKNPKDAATFERLAEESADLVRHYGGSLSGEHGDGRLRAPYLARVLGDEAYGWCQQVKRAFDPEGLFNPGKIVHARPVTEAWRTPPGRPTPAVHTVFDWSHQEGLVRAVEACNGAGFCRQHAGRGATMCPSYMATGEEADTPRGRANVLRQLLNAGDPDAAWMDPDLAEVLDTCLSCKACATECPSSVDVARMKAEAAQRRNDLEGACLRNRLMGYYALFARIGSRAPRLATACMNHPLFKRMMGLAPSRQLPAFAAQPFGAWWRAHTPRAGMQGEVVLFVDEFTEHIEPSIGIAAVEALEGAGYRVHALTGLESGRTQLSKGFLRGARRRMARAVEAMAPHAERGVALVGLEPSAILGFRDEASDLVPCALRAQAEAVARHARLFEEFIVERAKAGAMDGPPQQPLADATTVLVHGHCHQKALAGTKPTVELLNLIPELRVVEIPSGCCGMAGSFGYEREHAELSMQIGELILFPAVRAHPDALICASGMSCRAQIQDGTGRAAVHPAVLWRRAMGTAR